MENQIEIAGKLYPKEEGIEYLMSAKELSENVKRLRDVYMPELANQQNLETRQKITIK